MGRAAGGTGRTGAGVTAVGATDVVGLGWTCVITGSRGVVPLGSTLVGEVAVGLLGAVSTGAGGRSPGSGGSLGGPAKPHVTTKADPKRLGTGCAL